MSSIALQKSLMAIKQFAIFSNSAETGKVPRVTESATKTSMKHDANANLSASDNLESVARFERMELRSAAPEQIARRNLTNNSYREGEFVAGGPNADVSMAKKWSARTSRGNLDRIRMQTKIESMSGFEATAEMTWKSAKWGAKSIGPVKSTRAYRTLRRGMKRQVLFCGDSKYDRTSSIDIT
jgi:hypothetical protein